MVTAEWLITAWYLLALAVIVAAAKWTSTRRTRVRTEPVYSFWLAPSLCLASWQKRGVQPPGWRSRIVQRTAIQLVLLACVYTFWVPRVSCLEYWAQAYCAILPFWLLIETIQSLCRLLWFWSGRVVPAINHQPLRSKTLREFWGQRWNMLFGDWLRQVIFKTLKKSKYSALLGAFLVSGLLHEILVSLPYQLAYEGDVWGWVSGYFLLQFFGVALERHFFPSAPRLNRVFTWLVVLVPVPLILNPATLRIFHLTATCPGG